MDNDPQLYVGEDGAPRSARFGDIYYSLQDGLDESRAVFLAGCHLPDDWDGFEDFTVLELGFGTGLNVIALMQMWAQHRPPDAHLHILSVEGFLMTAAQAKAALDAWPELAAYADALIADWPAQRRGFHHASFPQWGIHLTVATMEVADALAAWQGTADAIFLDGFSPALNPGMWRQDVLDAVAAKARPGARLATFTVAGAVRRGLEQAGFTVRKCPGFGRKRERLEAMYTPNHGYAIHCRPRRIAVIGAGIAGCSVAWQARALGLDADVFDPDGAGAGASGNPAALVTPRLDAGDNDISALFADAFAYSGALYRRLCPDAIIGEGMAQLAKDERDDGRFARIAGQTGFAPGDMAVFGPGGHADTPDHGGLHLNTALHVRPDLVLKAMLGATIIIPSTVASVRERYVIATDGQVHGPYDAVIVTAGAGVFGIDDIATRLGLRAVRGQVERAEASERPSLALGWGGYALPVEGGIVFGATHERDDHGTEPREQDRAHNLASLATVMPGLAAAAAEGWVQSRASTRVTTRDYLPVVGEVAPGSWLLSGLGARGFCLAPLLAKALLCDLLGVPSPLRAVAKMLLRPGRRLAS